MKKIWVTVNPVPLPLWTQMFCSVEKTNGTNYEVRCYGMANLFVDCKNKPEDMSEFGIFWREA